MSLPQRIVNKLVRLEKSIVSYPIENKIKELRQKYDDNVLNRELLVVDKYGNRYYQHYSSEGVPTRRYVALNMKSFNKWDEDPTMLGWLQFRRQNPPTQEELEKVYLLQEERERRGLEWDRKEAKIINEYKNKNKLANNEEKKMTGSTGEGNNFMPGKWDPKRKDSSLAELENNSLINTPKWDLLEYENIHGLKGKYMSDLHLENEAWMENQTEKRFAPLNKALANINMNDYSLTTMSTKFNMQRLEKKEKLQERIKEVTKLREKMMEKKEKFKGYANFRGRYKDVFEEYGI